MRNWIALAALAAALVISLAPPAGSHSSCLGEDYDNTIIHDIQADASPVSGTNKIVATTSAGFKRHCFAVLQSGLYMLDQNGNWVGPYVKACPAVTATTAPRSYTCKVTWTPEAHYWWRHRGNAVANQPHGPGHGWDDDKLWDNACFLYVAYNQQWYEAC